MVILKPTLIYESLPKEGVAAGKIGDYDAFATEMPLTLIFLNPTDNKYYGYKYVPGNNDTVTREQIQDLLLRAFEKYRKKTS